ncbi:MAG: rna polymerase sigma factor region 2 [Verrucomicrobiales bacterium]|jgi:RNA polymerase sigma-70 factor (ECF subfamily)|nr:rna polymerase sigma factor region 2 [Verrucomicrobiales bacterium]MDB6129111.1 rna polymerase sigma factor region 2 [Verrucomicrobiales bacterium]
MSDSHDHDAELMLRVRDGDILAFEELVEKYKQLVIHVAYRSLKDQAEAEDLAQTVFVQVFKSASRYEPTAKFSTWLFTICRNLCLNEIRRRSRHPAESLDEPVQYSEDSAPRQYEDLKVPGASDLLLREELEQKIDEAINDLPENQRTALMLCKQEEASYEDISAILGCSLSATKSLIHRARETLKMKLKPYLKSGVWQQ